MLVQIRRAKEHTHTQRTQQACIYRASRSCEAFPQMSAAFLLDIMLDVCLLAQSAWAADTRHRLQQDRLVMRQLVMPCSANSWSRVECRRSRQARMDSSNQTDEHVCFIQLHQYTLYSHRALVIVLSAEVKSVDDSMLLSLSLAAMAFAWSRQKQRPLFSSVNIQIQTSA